MSESRSVSASRESVRKRESRPCGWVVVMGMFVVILCTRAVTRSMSTFFLELSHHFGEGSASIAWIISINDCITMLCAPFGALLSRRIGTRLTVMLGGLLSSCGLVLGSFCTNMTCLYMGPGFLSGFGNALSFTPTLALIGLFFEERRAFAIGLATTGYGVGTFVLPPISQFLIETFGWRGAMIILGGIVTHICVTAALFQPPPSPEPMQMSSGDKNDFSSHQDGCDVEKSEARLTGASPYQQLLRVEFLSFSFVTALVGYGAITPLVYIVPYSQFKGFSDQKASFLLSVIGIMDIVGTVTSGWLIDRKCLRAHQTHCYASTIFIYALVTLLLPTLNTYSQLMTCMVIYGYFDGAISVLIPLVVSTLIDSKHAPTALSIVYSSLGIPYLVGPPISGWLVDLTSGYTLPFVLSGLIKLLGMVILEATFLWTNCLKSRKNKQESCLPVAMLVTS
uniref:monocarboxylate transporter 12-B-like n=1 Tax=Myxine glutinosa TaxID=7769 RepID=UPI0035900E59